MEEAKRGKEFEPAAYFIQTTLQNNNKKNHDLVWIRSLWDKYRLNSYYADLELSFFLSIGKQFGIEFDNPLYISS